MKFLVINGPNLNLLGQREPGIYGSNTYAHLCDLVRGYAAARGCTADCYQSNHEGAIIDTIQAAQGKYDAIVINPGAYTHYSYAIHDALKAVTVPAFEVHISDISTREAFRRISVTAPACVGQVYGLGFDGYLRAMDHFLPPQQPAPLCVIGSPVAHSKSPSLHNAMLTHLGLDPVYSTCEVTSEALPAFVRRAKTGEFGGFNATMPHKQALLPLLDVMDEEVRLLGAANTVTVEGGKLVGHNTDGRGFVAALEDELQLSPAGKHIVLLGAGGAARAVAVALARAGAAKVTVCNRDQSKAQALCALCPDVLTPAPLTDEALRTLLPSAHILVNCTSLGMSGQGEFETLSFLAALPRESAVCDIVYQPRETVLLRAAGEQGHPTMNGLGMLLHQAIFALEHFLHCPLNHKELAQIAKEAF